MRYYIADNNGKVHGESENKEYLVCLIVEIFTPAEIVEKEIEIIEE